MSCISCSLITETSAVSVLRTSRANAAQGCVCVCVCVCVFVCGHVYVVYEDTNLYNDMGMT